MPICYVRDPRTLDQALTPRSNAYDLALGIGMLRCLGLEPADFAAQSVRRLASNYQFADNSPNKSVMLK